MRNGTLAFELDKILNKNHNREEHGQQLRGSQVALGRHSAFQVDNLVERVDDTKAERRLDGVTDITRIQLYLLSSMVAAYVNINRK